MTSLAFILGVVPLMVQPAPGQRAASPWGRRYWRHDRRNHAEPIVHSHALRGGAEHRAAQKAHDEVARKDCLDGLPLKVNGAT